MATDALIVDAVRSPIGRRNGSLAGTRGDELAGAVLNGLVARNDLDPAEVEDAQMGCVTQIGERTASTIRASVAIPDQLTPRALDSAAWLLRRPSGAS